MMRASSPTELARIGRRQKENDIDVGQVEDRDDRRAGGDDLAIRAS